MTAARKYTPLDPAPCDRPMRVLVLSTAHICAATSDMLDESDISMFASDYGYLFNCAADETDWPEDLKECTAFARKHNCGYLRLDCDGPKVNELEEYNW